MFNMVVYTKAPAAHLTSYEWNEDMDYKWMLFSVWITKTVNTHMKTHYFDILIHTSALSNFSFSYQNKNKPDTSL